MSVKFQERQQSQTTNIKASCLNHLNHLDVHRNNETMWQINSFKYCKISKENGILFL